MGDLVGFVLRIALAAVFSVAALAKLRDRDGTAAALESFGLPSSVAAWTRHLLPGAELISVVLLLVPSTYVVGAVWSLLLLTAFTLAISVNLIRGRRPECRCFGELSAQPIGPSTIVRNALLAAIAVAIATLEPPRFADVQTWWHFATNNERALLLSMGTLAGVIAVQSWRLQELRRRTIALALRLESVERPRATEPTIGEPAPRFSLPTTEGSTLNLDGLLERGRPVLLVFVGSNCSACESLLPDLSTWQKSLSNVFTLGLISHGGLEVSSAMAARAGLSDVMVQTEDEVAELFGSRGTPSAIRVTATGRLDSAMEYGVDRIRALFDELVAAHAQELWARSTPRVSPRGLPEGTEVPDRALADLDGREQLLSQVLADRTLLMFWSPRCGFCRQMVDDLRALEGELKDDHRLIFVTNGSPEENRALGIESLMLLDTEFALGSALGASGTPSAIWIEGGRIASALEAGADGVLRLAGRFADSGRPADV